jgi:hypothetical protein
MDEMPRKTAAELEAECLLPSEGLGHHPDDERKLRTSHPERTGREARPTRETSKPNPQNTAIEKRSL